LLQQNPALTQLITEELNLFDEILAAGENGEDRTEIEADWQIWQQELFPQYCRYRHSRHQIKFWDWIWSIELGESSQSFMAIWPRGHGKSTSAELAVVALGARNKRRYCLYISETQDQADKHIMTIASMLESAGISVYYPKLGQKRVGKFGNSTGWRRNRLVTATGFVVDAIGLDVAARGIRFEDARPDFLIFDDIDSKHDSAAATLKKIETITTSLIPAGSMDMVVLGVQNLIHKDSIFSRLADNRAEFLADRIPATAIPAIRNFQYLRRTDGRPGHVITGGEPTWDGASLAVCQKLIDKMGIYAFLSECQQEVKSNVQGAYFAEYNEIYHVITRSEFIEYYQERAIDDKKRFHVPFDWNCGKGLDWGTTPAHPCSIVYGSRPNDGEKFDDSVFIYRELIFPSWPNSEDDEVSYVSPGRVARAINDAERTFKEASRMKLNVMSHEASATYNTFRYDLDDDLKQYFVKWSAKYGNGIAQIQEYLAIDFNKDHPFRRYPEGHPQAGEPIKGMPRFFIIVEDNQGALYYDDEDRIQVRAYINAEGLARLRWEIPKYHKKVDAAGEELDRVDDKKDDDAVDALRYLAAFMFPKQGQQDPEKRREKQLPIRLQKEEIAKADPKEQALLLQTRMMLKARIEKNETKPKSSLGFLQNRNPKGRKF